MYKFSFYIKEKVWNNAFSFEKRKNKKLFVPSLIKAKSFFDVEIWEEIAFEDFDFDDKLQSCIWLKNFYEFDFFPSLLRRGLGGGKKLYLFDNHNHAYFFWYLARENWLIKNNSKLYHIDEHADTRDPWKFLNSRDTKDLQKVFDFTNFFLNVWNYIIPAQKEWLIWEIIQIRSESDLKSYLESVDMFLPNISTEKESSSIILNLDLDFFQPDLDFIDYELKKKVVLNIAKKADLITVCTSPFFIKQELALKVFKDLFFES